MAATSGLLHPYIMAATSLNHGLDCYILHHGRYIRDATLHHGCYIRGCHNIRCPTTRDWSSPLLRHQWPLQLTHIQYSFPVETVKMDKKTDQLAMFYKIIRKCLLFFKVSVEITGNLARVFGFWKYCLQFLSLWWISLMFHPTSSSQVWSEHTLCRAQKCI